MNEATFSSDSTIWGTAEFYADQYDKIIDKAMSAHNMGDIYTFFIDRGIIGEDAMTSGMGVYDLDRKMTDLYEQDPHKYVSIVSAFRREFDNYLDESIERSKGEEKTESLKTYAGDPITPEEVNQGWEDLEKRIKGLKPGDLITLHNPFDPNGFEHKHVERRTDKPDYYRIYDEGPGGFANEIEYGTLEDALYWAKKTYYSTLIDDDPAESFMDF